VTHRFKTDSGPDLAIFTDGNPIFWAPKTNFCIEERAYSNGDIFSPANGTNGQRPIDDTSPLDMDPCELVEDISYQIHRHQTRKMVRNGQKNHLTHRNPRISRAYPQITFPPFVKGGEGGIYGGNRGQFESLPQP
jgi:hypothetical protein